MIKSGDCAPHCARDRYGPSRCAPKILARARPLRFAHPIRAAACAITGNGAADTVGQIDVVPCDR